MSSQSRTLAGFFNLTGTHLLCKNIFFICQAAFVLMYMLIWYFVDQISTWVFLIHLFFYAIFTVWVWVCGCTWQNNWVEGGWGVGGGIASSITPCSARATESSLQNKEVSLGCTRKLKPIYLKWRRVSYERPITYFSHLTSVFNSLTRSKRENVLNVSVIFIAELKTLYWIARDNVQYQTINIFQSVWTESYSRIWSISFICYKCV